MKVSEVMTRGAECTRPEATLQEAADQMRKLDVGALPVCGNDKLVGMITDRDIAVRSVATGDNPMLGKVQDAMTPTVVYCYEDQDVSEAAEIMKDRQIRRLVVLNRDKRLAGIVSLGDLAVEARDDRMTGDALEAISEPAAPSSRGGMARPPREPRPASRLSRSRTGNRRICFSLRSRAAASTSSSSKT